MFDAITAVLARDLVAEQFAGPTRIEPAPRRVRTAVPAASSRRDR